MIYVYLQSIDVIISKAQRFNLGELGFVGEGGQDRAQLLQGVVQGLHTHTLTVVCLQSDNQHSLDALSSWLRPTKQWFHFVKVQTVNVTTFVLQNSELPRQNFKLGLLIFKTKKEYLLFN